MQNRGDILSVLFYYLFVSLSCLVVMFMLAIGVLIGGLYNHGVPCILIDFCIQFKVFHIHNTCWREEIECRD